MSRISIDVTTQEHQRLKAMAALQGKSIKEFVLDRTLGTDAENQALLELEGLLRARQKEGENGAVSTRSVESIFQQARDEADHGSDV